MWEHPVALVVIAALVGSAATMLVESFIKPYTAEATERRRHQFAVARYLDHMRYRAWPRPIGGEALYYEKPTEYFDPKYFKTKTEKEISIQLQVLKNNEGELVYAPKSEYRVYMACAQLLQTSKWRPIKYGNAKRKVYKRMEEHRAQYEIVYEEETGEKLQ